MKLSKRYIRNKTNKKSWIRNKKMNKKMKVLTILISMNQNRETLAKMKKKMLKTGENMMEYK